MTLERYNRPDPVPELSTDSAAAEVQMAPVMRVRDWLLLFLLLIIPFVNLILMFYWAFSSSGNPNRRSYCRAFLVVFGILIIAQIVMTAMGLTDGVESFDPAPVRQPGVQ